MFSVAENISNTRTVDDGDSTLFLLLSGWYYNPPEQILVKHKMLLLTSLNFEFWCSIHFTNKLVDLHTQERLLQLVVVHQNEAASAAIVL